MMMEGCARRFFASLDTGGAVEMKPLMLVMCVALVMMLGCGPSKRVSVPDEIKGTWVTSAPKYADSSMEITNGSIIFKTGFHHRDSNHITKIEQAPERLGGLYHIHYEKEPGETYTLSMYHYRGPEGGVIRFKNQKQIAWRKK